MKLKTLALACTLLAALPAHAALPALGPMPALPAKQAPDSVDMADARTAPPHGGPGPGITACRRGISAGGGRHTSASIAGVRQAQEHEVPDRALLPNGMASRASLPMPLPLPRTQLLLLLNCCWSSGRSAAKPRSLHRGG